MSDVSQLGGPTAQLAGRCAYCGKAAWLYLTGRRYICGECWREHLGEAPPRTGDQMTVSQSVSPRVLANQPKSDNALLTWELDDEAMAGADALNRLKDAQIGAAAQPGYAVYFYDEKGDEILSVDGFASPRDAAAAVSLIRARAVVNAAEAVWGPIDGVEEMRDA